MSNENLGPDGRGWEAREVEYSFPGTGPGQSVVINTTRSVHVEIMDDENYQLKKAGEDYRAFTGQIHSSPHRFKIPREGDWHVIIDPQTYSGIAEFMVRVNDDAMLDS